MARPTVLLDGDIILYRACVGAERETDWGDDIWSLTSDLGAAKKSVEDSITQALNTVNGDLIFCVNDVDNFRKHLNPDYKGGRSRKPLGYYHVLNWVREDYEVRSLPKCEADDTLGILSTSGEFAHPVIMSGDKDMKTIPGRFIRGREWFNHSEGEADYWHLFQTLTGDITDGYKGCPGIGPKTAEALLKANAHAPWNAVIEAFKKAKLTEEDALLQARMARILRAEDYNLETKEPILWTPKPDLVVTPPA